MSEGSSRDKPVEKMPYIKPRLRTIELVAEEVLGVGCKNSGTSAVGPVPCYVNNCAQDGS